LLDAMLASLLAAALAAAPAPPPPPLGPDRPADRSTRVQDHARELGRVTFAAAGDTLPHVSVKRAAEAADARDAQGRSLNSDGFDALFAEVAPDLAGADFTLVNLETPVSPSGDAGNVEFHFNAPPALLRALRKAGVDIALLANNHAYDQGRKGLAETLDEVAKAGLLAVGAGKTKAEAWRGARLEKNGLRIAIVGASALFNDAKAAGVKDPTVPQVARATEEKALVEALKAARAEADFVVFAVHWGAEYQPAPRESERALFQKACDAGADVVVGGHAHVLQPIEVGRAEDGRPCAVIYSLGNFISNQSRQYQHGISPKSVGDTRDGALFRFTAVKRDWGHGVVRTELGPLSYVALWTDNERKKGDERKKKDGQEAKESIVIRTVAIGRAIAQARWQLDALEATLEGPVTKEQADELVRLKKRIALLEDRREIIAARLGEGYEVDPVPFVPPTPAAQTAAKPDR
jgi:hypothetical protein